MHEILQKLSTALESEPDIAFAYLFGSVAKGRSGPLSDVDVAVYFYPEGDARSRFRRQIQLRVDFVFRVVRDYLDAEPLRKLEWEALEAYFNDENYGYPTRRYPRPPKKAAGNAGRAEKNSLARKRSLLR